MAAKAKRARVEKPTAGAKTSRLYSLDELEGEHLTPVGRAEVNAKANEKIAAIRLQRLREKCNLTQEALAKRLGVSQAALSKMERRENVTLETILTYLAGLGASLQMKAIFEDGKRENLLDYVVHPTKPLRKKDHGPKRRRRAGL
jgi:DNA-binding XRE family transcriptional regulator